MDGVNGTAGQCEWCNASQTGVTASHKNNALSDAYSMFTDALKSSSGNAVTEATPSNVSASTEDNATDEVSLSSGLASSLQYARVSFEISYQTISSISNANGSQIQSTSFSLSGSFEFMSIASGNTSSSYEDIIAQLQGTDTSSTTSAIDDYFSAENTAERILDFALSFFEMSDEYEAEGDTESARAAYAERMGDAIQEGFDQALGILGDLPDSVADTVEETHDLVFEGLQEFIENGLDTAKEEEGLYAQIQEARWEFTMEMTEAQIDSDSGSISATSLSAQSSYSQSSLSSYLA